MLRPPPVNWGPVFPQYICRRRLLAARLGFIGRGPGLVGRCSCVNGPAFFLLILRAGGSVYPPRLGPPLLWTPGPDASPATKARKATDMAPATWLREEALAASSANTGIFIPAQHACPSLCLPCEISSGKFGEAPPRIRRLLIRGGWVIMAIGGPLSGPRTPAPPGRGVTSLAFLLDRDVFGQRRLLSPAFSPTSPNVVPLPKTCLAPDAGMCSCRRRKLATV